MTATVPGELSAAVNVNDGCAVGGTVLWLRAFASCIHIRVLQKKKRGVGFSGEDLGMEPALEPQACE